MVTMYLVVLRLLSKRFPQHGDVPGESTLFHTRVTPYLPEQLVFREHALAILDEHQERLENLWSQRYLFTVTQQQPPAGIEGERSELVKRRKLLNHWRPDISDQKRRLAVRTRNPREG